MENNQRILSAIVVVAENGAIGRDGGLLCHLPADLRHFKGLTMGHSIVMGRRTFESFPKGALPGRQNIVITRSRTYRREGFTVAHSLTEAIDAATMPGEVFIIGGAQIYAEHIADMLEKLSEGYDFVQASRFIKGGVGENTPASRSLAIRLIHAPLLSLASGFHWTDTTQGFRAYSAKLLSDSRVSILLAYLSYIAPKLGFRCVEVPGMRRYPKGQVPTKISSFKGNMNLMKVLVKACLGCYNRRDS